jgi:hypothetical protein
MTKPPTGIREVLLLLALFALPVLSFAQEEDPGLIRALNTDSPTIENTFYLGTSFDNNAANYHDVYLYGEGLLDLGNRWGIEVDFPNLYTWDPLGKYPAFLEPIGVFARYEAWRTGGWNTETAGAFSIEAGGSYGFPSRIIRSIGSSWTINALGGYRVGRFFLLADYSFQGGIDPNVPSFLQLNNSLGCRLGGDVYLQAESNLNIITAPTSDSSWAFVPQIAFQPGEWLFEFGESFGESPSAFTQVMVARAF